MKRSSVHRRAEKKRQHTTTDSDAITVPYCDYYSIIVYSRSDTTYCTYVNKKTDEKQNQFILVQDAVYLVC
jgi:hypothetical protein